MPRPRRAHDATTVRLKPADPFDLIRWLARSQSDPRKAVAELVQNSLDAGAGHVELRRFRLKKAMCLAIRDDGEGVLPELDRRAALQYLATHVGHSRKMGLDPAERARRVMAGKYGVGLLGFWSIGKFLELRTRVAGSELLALRLEEDAPRAEIFPLPLGIDTPPTFTELVVQGVHDTAHKALGGRRIADYLSSELRGQLLRRDVEVSVHDDVARGTAQKVFRVVPRKFSGEPLALPAEIEVPGHGPIKVEIYLARGAERPAVQVACAGTLVADDVAHLDSLGLNASPWVGRELVGMVDFGDLQVAPGTRRGVVPNGAAAAFAEAMDRLGALVLLELGRLDEERHSALDRDIVRDLRKALRGLGRRLPHYDLPKVGADAGEPTVAGAGPGTPLDDAPPRYRELEPLPLLPVGAMARVLVAPAVVRVAPGGERRVRARAVDADDRDVDGVTFHWTVRLEGAEGIVVRGEGPRPAVVVDPRTPLGAQAGLEVEARDGKRALLGEARIEVAEGILDDATSGIPEPVLVSDADGRWRSRMVGETWEVNDTHEDYRSLRGDTRARVRYLLALLAREIVIRTTGRHDAADVLDQMVEVLAHAERNLRGS